MTEATTQHPAHYIWTFCAEACLFVDELTLGWSKGLMYVP